MNAAQVDTAISKASRLMNEDYMALLDGVSAMKFGGKVNNRRGAGTNKKGNDLAFLDRQVFGYSTQPQAQQQYQPQYAQQEAHPQHQFSSSALQESFAQMPPISDNNFPGSEYMGVSASGAGYQPGASLLREQVQQPYVQQNPVYQPQQQAGGIDYNAIKYFINEAIKENIAALKQSLLAENALTGVRMPGGNKIQFLDKSGNVYEGQLILKKKKQ